MNNSTENAEQGGIKQLAKAIALAAVRNTYLEDLHSGGSVLDSLPGLCPSQASRHSSSQRRECTLALCGQMTVSPWTILRSTGLSIALGCSTTKILASTSADGARASSGTGCWMLLPRILKGRAPGSAFRRTGRTSLNTAMPSGLTRRTCNTTTTIDTARDILTSSGCFAIAIGYRQVSGMI